MERCDVAAVLGDAGGKVAQQAAQEGAMAAQYAYDKLTKKTSAITGARMKVA